MVAVGSALLATAMIEDWRVRGLIALALLVYLAIRQQQSIPLPLSFHRRLSRFDRAVLHAETARNLCTENEWRLIVGVSTMPAHEQHAFIDTLERVGSGD